MRVRVLTVLICMLTAHNSVSQPFEHAYPEQFSSRADMADAIIQSTEIVRPWIATPSVVAMLDGVDDLPSRIRRWRWSTSSFGETTYTMDQYDELDEDARARLGFIGVPERIYYGGWTSDAPFIEFRAFDLALADGRFSDPASLAGARVLLIDATVITHAWLLAQLGADVTVVTQSQRFKAVYDAPSDRGTVRGVDGAPDGSITIINANWPADETIDLGEPFDLVIAINTLNAGRSDPSATQRFHDQPTRITKTLGSSVESAAERIADAVAPGGRLFFYNWGLPARPNRNPSPGGDVRPMITPDLARAAGLDAVALASDASIFNRMLGRREQTEEVRRPVSSDGLTAPQLSVVYAVYDKPATEN